MADSQYFGIQPTNVRDVENRYRYLASNGQTTFAAIYDIGYVDVYYNGSHLDPGSAFTATDGVSVILANPAVAGASVVIVSKRQVAYMRGVETMLSSPTFTTTAGQTTFNVTYIAGTVYNVTRNGIGVPYDASNGTQVILSTAANAGDEVKIFYYTPFSAINAVAKGGDNMTGALTLSAGGTTITPAPGNNSTAIANTAFVNAAIQTFSGEFLSSLTTSGYQKLPSGLIIQWGRITTTQTGTISFPITFPNACLSISGVCTGSSAISNSLTFNLATMTSSQITYYQGGTWSFTWMAVGY